MRVIALIAAVVVTLLFPPEHASAVPLRGLASMDMTADGQYIVIAGRKDRSVMIVDVSSPPYSFSVLTASDGIGIRPHRVRCFGSNAVIVNEHDTVMTVIDVPSATVIHQVVVPMYTQDVVWDDVRSRYYVSNHWLDRVYVFDGSWNQTAPLDGIVVGRQPGPMIMSPDDRLFVGNRGTWDVSVVDPDMAIEVDRVHLGSRPEDLAATDTSVLVTNHGGTELTILNGVPMITNDQVDIRNVITEIDPATLSTTDRFVDQGADYRGIDVRAGMIVFAGAATGTVHIHDMNWPPNEAVSIDLLAGDVLPGGRVGNNPNGNRIFTNTRDVIARFPDQIFALNFLRDTLAEVQFTEGGYHVVGELPLNPVGEPIVAFQPEPAVNMELHQHGERYFNTIAAWSRGQEDFSCQTCHSDGHSDLRMIFSTKPDPFNPDVIQGPERHPSARFTAFSAPYGWEGNNVELLDINVQALDDHDIPPANGEVAIDTAQFMVVYQETLTGIPNPNPSDNPVGQALFEGAAGCADCHNGPAYTDHGFHNVGTGRVLNTPSLLGVWDQAHLLHDARAVTLEDVFDPGIYERGGPPHGNLVGLSNEEIAELAAYVRGLTGPGQFPCGPDINCDGVVDLVDLLELLSEWGNCVIISTCPADLDDSGVVDVGDLLILLGAWTT